jgi:hypothetical protein
MEAQVPGLERVASVPLRSFERLALRLTANTVWLNRSELIEYSTSDQGEVRYFVRHFLALSGFPYCD